MKLDAGKWLAPPEVAEYLSISESTLALWRRTGQGPRYAKLTDRSCRYLSDDVVKWAESKRIKAKP